MKKFLKNILEFFDSKSTLSNMRLNVTMVITTVCICLLSITFVICWQFHRVTIDGTTVISWGALLVGLVVTALGYKNAQAKIENQNSVAEPGALQQENTNG